MQGRGNYGSRALRPPKVDAEILYVQGFHTVPAWPHKARNLRPYRRLDGQAEAAIFGADAQGLFAGIADFNVVRRAAWQLWSDATISSAIWAARGAGSKGLQD